MKATWGGAGAVSGGGASSSEALKRDFLTVARAQDGLQAFDYVAADFQIERQGQGLAPVAVDNQHRPVVAPPLTERACEFEIDLVLKMARVEIGANHLQRLLIAAGNRQEMVYALLISIFF